MAVEQDPPKTLTQLEAEILYSIWYATAANSPPGLQYKEMLNCPGIRPTSMFMLKKTVGELKSRSLITSYPDHSKPYPPGRHPQVYRLDYDYVPATLDEAAILYFVHSYIRPPLVFPDIVAMIGSDPHLRRRDIKDPTILLRIINHSHALGYLRDRLDSSASETEIRGTPRLQAHIAYLHKIVFHDDKKPPVICP